MLNKENYVPWSSRLLRYAKSRPNGKLIHNSILNGPYVRKMIPEPGDANRDITVTESFHLQTDDELSDKELKQIEADDQAIHTILLGLPEDIYAAVDSCETAREIWLRVQQMMKGSDIGIQEKKAKLFNEWEREVASNLKFLNNLQPEWSRHVTIVHQTKDLHTADYTQLYDFLKYNQKENVGNQNGLIGVQGNGNQSQIGNGNLVAARAEKNVAGQNRNQIRCYNCRGVGHYARNCTIRPRRRDADYLQTQLLIAQKKEAGIQLQAEEYDLMVVAADLDKIEEVNANCILMANLQQASTSSTQTDSAPVYDTDGSAEVYENYDDNEIFNMFTQEEQYTELLEPIPESHQVPQNDNDVISEDTSVEQGGETVEQHPANFKKTRALYESLDQNLAIEVKKVNSVNRKLKETNADLTTELARYKNQERCFEISQDKYDKLESQDIMIIVQNESVVDTSDLQTELERTKERFENCIIKKETEYAKLSNDWYKKCDECKYDKISHDKAYKDMQQKIKRLQAQLGDLKGKSKDTSCVSDTRNPLSQKLEDKNVKLEFQKEVDELKAERLAKTQDPLALMANSNNLYTFSATHQDQSSFNQNYLQQLMPNPKDITDPTTAVNMALSLMAKAFKLNYSTPTNNNQRISSNPRNRQIAQPESKSSKCWKSDGLIGVQGNGNQNQIGNGHFARDRTIRPRKRDAAYLQTQLEIEEVNANCILMANLQQAS
nr:hypothetical protein [Tanacetum cinerariifolium]